MKYFMICLFFTAFVQSVRSCPTTVLRKTLTDLCNRARTKLYGKEEKSEKGKSKSRKRKYDELSDSEFEDDE